MLEGTGKLGEKKLEVAMTSPKKIILIVIDTLRADHLGCYGYKRNTSLNIDEFAKNGLKFDWPFAPISYTVPSITSLFTGKYPGNHCTMFSNGAPVKSIESDVFLTDILGSEGYETAAFVSSLVIGKVRKVAMTSGFNIYNDDMTAHELNRLTELIRSGAETNEAIFKWLEKNYNINFFLFVHYFDVHGPYVNPKPYDNIFVNDDYYGESKFIDKIVPEDKALGGIPDYQVLAPKRDDEENLIDFEKDIRYYIAQYDGGIRYCDEQIGNIFNKLRELGIYDDCLIILTSDHGEALGENNVYFYHGLTVTMDQIHVPLIIKPHTDWRPNTNLIGAPVSLVDIMPTILDLIGFDFLELDIDGVSILDIEKYTNRKIISEIEPQIAYIDKSLIHLKSRANLDEKKYFPYIKELCCEEKRFNYRKDTNREDNSMVLEWTGERYLPFVKPEISGAEIHYEHLHRYAFAAQFVKGKKVLDFASGEGYGSYMLSKEAERVIGVEIDEKAVKHASSTYISDNLKFMQGSILKVPIEGEKMFDAIISFEAIEHVEEHEELMHEVKRLLKEDGVFIVSSPNKKVYTDDSGCHNPFHLKELYFDEFKNLLEEYFTNTYFFGQRVCTASNLWCLTSREAPNYSEFVIKKGDDEFYFSDGNRKVPVYFIAVGSNADLNLRYKMSSYLVDASNILVEDYKRQINEFSVSVQGKDERILNLEGQIADFFSQVAEKEEQINDLNVVIQGKNEQMKNLEGQITDFSSQLTEKDERIDELDVVVQGKDAQIINLEAQITDIYTQLKEKEQQIDELNVAFREKDAQLRNFDELKTTISDYLKEKDKQIDDLDVSIQEKDKQIMDLEGQITEFYGRQKEKELRKNELNVALQGKDEQILNLEAQIANISGQLKEREEKLGEIGMKNLRINSELNSIKSSMTWRTMMKWHSFVENVMPQGTKSRRWYDQRLIRLRTSANEDGRISSGNDNAHRTTKEIVQSSVKSTKTEAPKSDLFSEDLEKIQNIYKANYGDDFISDIDKRDEMYQFLVNCPSVKDPTADYFGSGELMRTNLQEVFDDIGYSFNQIDTFLDFACGYGRFTRFLVQKLNNEKITVSDIDKNAVDFVKRTFGVNGFYSVDYPDRLIHATKYDVIFVASLFTHLPLRLWGDWLKRLYDMLNDGGILIFSTHGMNHYYLLDDETKALVEKIEEGFYYLPKSFDTERLSAEFYGTTYVSYDYVGKFIRQNDIGKIIAYHPKKLCNFQDIYVIKKDNTKIMFDGASPNNEHIASLSNEKEDRIRELGKALAKKDKGVRVLEEGLEDRNQHIQRLKGEVTDIENAIAQKDERIRELEVSLEDRNQHILHLEGKATEIRNAITQREERIREIEMENRRFNSDLDSIKPSATWRTVMKWHSFIEKSIPLGTRRRRYYDLSVIGLRTITNEGWSSFWWKYKQHRSSKKHTELIAKSTEERILETATDKIELPENSLDTFKSYKLLNFLSQSGVNLYFPKFDEPVVSIITLTFNKAEFTYQYLESILAHTDIPYELILVDNGSQDETTSLLDRLENVTTIKNEVNLGFIKGCNQGASKAKGKYLLFLNNDIIVTPVWLSKLVKTIENYPKCGAVGCKLIWPNGKLQEAGSIIWSDGSALGYGREGDPMHPEYSYLREVDYCSGACLLVRKDIFQRLGEFDERYIPAYYEDSDLCLGIWGLGYKVVFQPGVVVFHNEFTSSSFNKATALMATNQSKFVAKRKDALRDKLDPSQNNVLFARDLRPGNRILVIDDRVPTPYQGAGYPRADRMLRFLGELRYKVTLFPLDNATPWQPYTNELQQLGIEVFYGDNLDFIRFAQDRAGYYDLILVSRPHNMEMAVGAIKRFFSNAVLLYDAEAMFSIREILKAKVKRIKLKDEDSERMINNEINLMKRADMIITISENERRTILEREKLDNIEIWGHPINVNIPKKGFHERKDILFVGGFFALESPNEDAVLYFAKEVFPKIQKELSCRLFIVGINPPDSVKKLSSSSVIVTGFVPDLREYYDRCRVFVVPHRYSAGIPWKLQEAMSYGIPSVVSELTASQLDLTDGNEVLIAKDAEEFVQQIIKLYQDEKLWHQIQQNTLEYIKDTCNPEIHKTTLNELIMKGLQIKNKRYSKEDFKDKPKISIITPVWNPDKKWLRLAIESVINQIYDNWELCIAADGSTKPEVKRFLDQYAKKDRRIKLKFFPENKGIATNSNEALSLATTDFVGFLDQNDELDQFAINEVVNLLNGKPDFEFVYTDNDKIDKKGRRKDPFFKPEWSPDMFLSYNYLSHFTVIKKSIIDKVGGFREGYDGSFDYDLFLRVTESIDEQGIAHIPKILYHRRLVPGSTAEIVSVEPQALVASKNKALTDALSRRGIEGEILDGLSPGSYRIRYKISGSPKVSIIIPTKDKVNTLKTCVESILEKTGYENYEIIIVDNQSKEEETFEYYDMIKHNPKIKILEYSKPFNFSTINNFAVAQVDTEYILFLNNDTEVIASEWLTAMLEHAQRKEVGAVGAKLLYPTDTIQHAGVILTGVIRITGHAHRHLPASSHGYAGRASIIQNFSAVTAACMLTKKSLFEEVGGFDEIHLPVAYNDLDYCLKLRQKGYLVVYTPYAELYHHEYLSRGLEDTPEKLARALKELDYIKETWAKVLENDPYYNPLSKFDNE